MAGTSQDRALRVVNEVLQSNRWARKDFALRLRHAAGYPNRWIYGRQGATVLVDFTQGSVDVMQNIRYYMMAELVGLAPARYCISCPFVHPPFAALLGDMLANLPRHKIVIYPAPPSFDFSSLSPIAQTRIRLFLRRPALTEAEYAAEFVPYPVGGIALGPLLNFSF